MRSIEGKGAPDAECRRGLSGWDIRKLRTAKSVVVDARKQLHVGVVAHAEEVVVLVDQTREAQFNNINGVAAGVRGEAVGCGMLVITSERPVAIDVVDALHHTIRGHRGWLGPGVRAQVREPA